MTSYDILPFGTRSEKNKDFVFVWFFARDCNSYEGYPHNNVPSTSLVLLQLRYDGTFGAVGGGVEKGEELIDALVRECQEEMMFTPDMSKLQELITHQNPKSKACIHSWSYEMTFDELKELRDTCTKAPHFNAECAGVNLVHICRYMTGRGEVGWNKIKEQRFASTAGLDLEFLVDKFKLLKDYSDVSTYTGF